MLEKHVFLSHDVDWRRAGPPKEHILERRDRFDQSVINSLDSVNPYDNFDEIMAIEEKYGCRSTFFFRTMYENGDFREYEDRINELGRSGWEIGLHLDPGSINDFDLIQKEYNDLQGITKTRIVGNRVHYLNYNEALLPKLKSLGIRYDSSLKHSKHELVSEDFGFYHKDVIQFPLTVMDAYMFSYMGINEENILGFFERVLKTGDVFTIVWHDNVLRMKGGRMYSKIMEFFHSNGVLFHTGEEMCTLVQDGLL